MQTQQRSLYRVREVPPEEYSTKTILVFEDDKMAKKGSKGLFEKREVKRTGKFYDVRLRGQRGTVRLSEDEFNQLGLDVSGVHLVDEDGNRVRTEM